MEIIEKKAKDVWKKVLKYLLENGNDFVDREGRVCRQILNVRTTIESVDSITKPIEIINSFNKWVYPLLEEIEALGLTKDTIPGYHFSYGNRAFNFNEAINQIDEFVVPLLKKDPTSRRATVVLYNPQKDSQLHKNDIPSMLIMNFNILNGKLHATTLVRSNDLFLGLPANMYQTFVIQRYIAKKVGCKIGSITTHSISAHIFEDQFEYIKKVI